jgi:uncharacterized protein YodC (DUF2158 family)
MATEFSIGQIVHLNSGSPDLKITELKGDRVTVEWDDGKQHFTFPQACLTTEQNANWKAQYGD